MNLIQVSVEVGYDLRTVELTHDEWAAVQNGQHLLRKVVDYYEGDAKILAAADKAQTGAEEYLVARMAVRILKSLQSKLIVTS